MRRFTSETVEKYRFQAVSALFGAFGSGLTTETGQVIVADTKWKRLKVEKAPTYDIPNADA